MKTAFLLTTFSISMLSLSVAGNGAWMHFNDGNSPLPSNSITAVQTVEDGVWVGTDAGLAFYDGAEWSVFTTETSALPHDQIHDIYEDAQNIVWVATDGGIVKITDINWEIFNEVNSGLPSNLTRSVSSDSEGNIWVGTWGSGLAKMTGNDWTVYSTGNSDLPSNGIFVVEFDLLGHPWIGTYNGGVSYFDGQNWATYNMSNSDLPNNQVRCITFDPDGAIWFGTDDGLARKDANDNWHVYNYQNIGYSFHNVFEGACQASGKKFFATNGGVIQFNEQSFHVITAQNSNLTSSNIRCLSFDSEGNLWLGTANDGLELFLPEGSVGIQEELATNPISIYPNPAENEIQLLQPLNSSGKSELIISNNLGQVIIQRQLIQNGAAPHRLDISSLNRGNYFISVVSNQGISTSKFLKL